MEGTYPLPEAQIDRFLTKIFINYPSAEDLGRILDETTIGSFPTASKVMDAKGLLAMQALVRDVPIASHVKDLVVRMVHGTHPDSELAPEIVKRLRALRRKPPRRPGADTNLQGRRAHRRPYNVSADDLEQNLLIAMRHRIILNFEGEAEASTTTPSSRKCSRR